MSKVVLDLSRLISRVRHSTPSGVDRVEMAYARGLRDIYGPDLAFAALHPTGRYGRLDWQVATAYLDELERRWAQDEGGQNHRSIPQVLPWLFRLLPSSLPKLPSSRSVYVQVSPHHLTKVDRVRQILRKENARFLCMVHDLIPLEYPEYARPNGAALHGRRMETVTSCADALIVNSAATGRSLQPWIQNSGRPIRTHVALLGTETLPASGEGPQQDRPYFVCIGTIEPRKNHLLLLHLWRNLAETLPQESIPRLVIIGRRGWENEQVLDMLDRCPALKAHVQELSGCPDQRLASLLRGARALLMPSFAEGFGMPVAEALSVDVPVICSDIPAHNEVGATAPDYIDPLDGPRWKAAILDHAGKGALWQAQMERIPHWQAPTWANHFGIVADAILELWETP